MQVYMKSTRILHGCGPLFRPRYRSLLNLWLVAQCLRTVRSEKLQVSMGILISWPFEFTICTLHQLLLRFVIVYLYSSFLFVYFWIVCFLSHVRYCNCICLYTLCCVCNWPCSCWLGAQIIKNWIQLFNGAPAHVGSRPPLMRFRNLTLIDNW
jgi:hypothetical protein